MSAVILIKSFFPENPDLKYVNFARCLTVKGFVMYGTSTCPHCADQKAMFGDAFDYINYIGCDTDSTECINKNIESVPTWDLPTGERILGVQALEELSRLSGCLLPK